MAENIGPTPAGGVRSTASFTDVTGAPTTDPAQAAAVEVVEYDADDNELARHYGRTDYPSIDPGGDAGGDENTDQAQGRQWDVWISVDGIFKVVDTLEELRAVQDAGALPETAWRTMLASMLTMPSWERAPQSLKDEAYRWLEATRPS